MKRSIKDQVKGKFHETKGNVKEVTGKILGNEKMEIEGKAEKAVGQVQEKLGDIEKVIEK